MPFSNALATRILALIENLAVLLRIKPDILFRIAPDRSYSF
jgi:hypothetical protein